MEDQKAFIVTYYFEKAVVLHDTVLKEIDGRGVVAIETEVQAWTNLGAASTALSRAKENGIGAPADDCNGIEIYPYHRLLEMRVVEKPHA